MARSAFWLAFDAVGSAAISMVGMLVASAIIGPEAVGLSAVALGIIQIAVFVVGALFADATVQSRRLTSPQLDAAFWTLLAFGAALAGAMLATAGFWADFYGQPALVPMLAVGSVVVLLTAGSSIQAAILRRHMRFRTLAVVNLASRLAGSAAAVALALAGYGAWSLVWQIAAAAALFSAACAVASGWRPRMRLPFRSIKGILSVGVPETLAQSVAFGAPGVFLGFVAYYLPFDKVGEISFALRLTDSLRNVIGAGVGRFCLALFSRQQGSPQRFREFFLDAARVVGAVALPAFAALAVCAPELIGLAFGPRWAGAVPHIQILSIVAGIVLARSVAVFAFTATARPAIPLFTNLFAVGATAALLLWRPPVSAVEATAYWVVPQLVVVVVDFALVRATLRIGVARQLRATVPALANTALLVVGMVGVRSVLLRSDVSPPLLLVLEAATGLLLLGPAVAVTLRGWRDRPRSAPTPATTG